MPVQRTVAVQIVGADQGLLGYGCRCRWQSRCRYRLDRKERVRRDPMAWRYVRQEITLNFGAPADG
ncbi:MAG: hypothetical protein ACF8CQ_11315 [Rhodopirellula sp. JB044]|uniref:hypothetical protein n=1 Tax=Rhodopirellula sp. JB044 TaxID=3342844 RepID=UPI00370CA494